MEAPSPSGSPTLRVFRDSAAASAALEAETTQAIQQAGRRGMTLGLPTGNTPLDLYRGWIRRVHAGELSFASVRTFNLDEYWPAPVGASFADFMREQLFRHVDLPTSAAGLLDGSVPADEVEAECARYEARIHAAGGIDLQILGLGLNGHIAFNEPGSAPDSRTRRVRLAAETRARAASACAEWAGCAEALTMGVGTILEARSIVVLAFGAAKAGAVERALHGVESAEFPATFLRRHAQVSWLLDAAAAARVRA